MSAKHTPGPWHAAITKRWPHGRPEMAEPALQVHGGTPQQGYDGNIITSVASDPHITEQDWANARLIAASPDLLAACEYAVRILDSDGKNSRSEIVIRCREAMAKAKSGEVAQ